MTGKRRVTGRHVFAGFEKFSIEWRSEENKRTTQHSLTLFNPTSKLIIAIKKAWNATEGQYTRWKTAKEIIEEELSK